MECGKVNDKDGKEITEQSTQASLHIFTHTEGTRSAHAACKFKDELCYSLETQRKMLTQRCLLTLQ